MSKDVLYLGSQSQARQRLLAFADISFKVLSHRSEEYVDHSQQNFDDAVLSIANHKMDTLILPDAKTIEKDNLFVLTADTLIKSNLTGEVLGKPVDKQQAIEMLALEKKAPVQVSTGCCLKKFQKHDDGWETIEKCAWTTGAEVEFLVDEASIETYFENFPFVCNCSGAGMIEDHGLSYLKSINGSYTAVIGLPLYELRNFLKQLDFNF